MRFCLFLRQIWLFSKIKSIVFGTSSVRKALQGRSVSQFNIIALIRCSLCVVLFLLFFALCFGFWYQNPMFVIPVDSSSQATISFVSVQARKAHSFRCSSSPQKVIRLFGDPILLSPLYYSYLSTYRFVNHHRSCHNNI